MIILGLERFDNKKVLLVGGNESIGVPCAVRKKNKLGFLELVRDNLISEGVDIETINFFSMLINKNWHVSEILKHNLSVEEIKRMQQVSIEMLREDIFGKLYFPRDLKSIYNVNPEDKDKKIADMIKSYEKVITVYQSGANNLMYLMQASPISAVMDKQIRQRAVEAMKSPNIIKNITNGMTNNIYDLLDINENMEIYMLSLYVPKLFSLLAKNNDEFKLMIEFINNFNKEVENVANSLGVRYVDITPIGKYCAKCGVDFHCTSKGNEYLGQIVTSAIEVGTPKANKVPEYHKFNKTNMGLDGMLENAYSRICTYEDALALDDYRGTILRNFSTEEQQILCEKLIDEHEQELAVYEKARKLCL